MGLSLENTLATIDNTIFDAGDIFDTPVYIVSPSEDFATAIVFTLSPEGCDVDIIRFEADVLIEKTNYINIPVDVGKYKQIFVLAFKSRITDYSTAGFRYARDGLNC